MSAARNGCGRYSTGYARVTDPVFNVRHNGVDVAIGITRNAASDILDAPDRPKGFWQVYRMERPMEGRKAAWSAPRIPRMPSMRVSAAERAKLLDKLRADGTMRADTMPEYDASRQMLTHASL